MSNLNEYPDQYLNYYNQIISVCQSCELYSELDDECLVENKNILEIVLSENPICPIGEW
jgi:hypothetical protein